MSELATTLLLAVASAAVASAVALLGIRRSRTVTGITPPPTALTTLIAAVLGAVTGAVLGPQWILAAVVAFVGGGAVLSVIDAQYWRLPHAVMVPLYAAVVPLVVLAALLDGQPARLLVAVGGALLYGAFHVVFKLVRSSGIGAGDVKLSPLLGLLLGWWGAEPMYFGFLLSYGPFALVGLVGWLTKRLTATSQLPFGPYLIGGCLVAVLVAGR